MRLVLSGGGTGGHIIPNIALIHELRRVCEQRNEELQLLYIGTRCGMEKQLVSSLHVPYFGITCGKLRRYFSLKNFIDFWKLPIGVVQAYFKLRKFRPQVIFCKGGYVCFPVAVAGKLLGIPVVLHESDVTPGLANRLSARFASVIAIAFEESRKYFGGNKKVVLTGNPVRRELESASRESGLAFTDFNEEKPVLLFMGGSLGAEFINQVVWQNLAQLLQHYQVIHICGVGKVKSPEELLKLLAPARGNITPAREKMARTPFKVVGNHAGHLLENYRAFSFVGQELKHLYALADLVIGRAGAISLAEIDFFEKPSIIIPLPQGASRGDQIENAGVFAKNHSCVVIRQEEFSHDRFLAAIKTLLAENPAHSIRSKKNKFAPLEKIIRLLETP